jgi:hypothetical protein
MAKNPKLNSNVKGRKTKTYTRIADSDNSRTPPSNVTIALSAAAAAAASALTVNAVPAAMPAGTILEFPTTRTFTIGTGGSASGATTSPMTALPYPVKAGQSLTFGAVTMTFTEDASAGATSVKHLALSGALAAGATATKVTKQAVSLKDDVAVNATSLPLDKPLAYSIASGDAATWDQLYRLIGGTSTGYQANPQVQTEQEPADFETEPGELTSSEPEITGFAPTIPWAAKFPVRNPAFREIQGAGGAGPKTQAGRYVHIKQVVYDRDGNIAFIRKAVTIITGYQENEPAQGFITSGWTFTVVGETEFEYIDAPA